MISAFVPRSRQIAIANAYALLSANVAASGITNGNRTARSIVEPHCSRASVNRSCIAGLLFVYVIVQTQLAQSILGFFHGLFCHAIVGDNFDLYCESQSGSGGESGEHLCIEV